MLLPYWLAYPTLTYLFLFATFVNAYPVCIKEHGIITFHTVHTTKTKDGLVTETCDITLTPITDRRGNPAVQEVRKCFLTITIESQQSSGGTATSSISISPIPSKVTSPTSTLASRFPTTTTPATPLSQAVPQTVPATSPSASALPAGDGSVKTSILPTSGANKASGTSSPDSSGSATAAFQLPGKKLSVLPIGLGVFAGISVIALIVVGLVTYERTKYRKAFRQRKLAEVGATMGYGGMAQRP